MYEEALILVWVRNCILSHLCSRTSPPDGDTSRPGRFACLDRIPAAGGDPGGRTGNARRCSARYSCRGSLEINDGRLSLFWQCRFPIFSPYF